MLFLGERMFYCSYSQKLPKIKLKMKACFVRAWTFVLYFHNCLLKFAFIVFWFFFFFKATVLWIVMWRIPFVLFVCLFVYNGLFICLVWIRIRNVNKSAIEFRSWKLEIDCLSYTTEKAKGTNYSICALE